MSARLATKRRKRRANERGVALIIVLGAITILTVFLTELQEGTSANVAAAVAERDALRAEYVARSGVNLSRLLVSTEPTIRRAIAPLFMMLKRKPPQIPVWAFSDMVLGPFNDEAGAAAFSGLAGVDTSTGKNLGLGGGSFVVSIVDEDSKLDLNVAARGEALTQMRFALQLLGLITPPQYNELFEGRDGDGQFSDRATICGALVDWADYDENLFGCDPSNTNASASGAEDNYYQTVGLDYLRKNAAFDSLDEVRLVRGMSDDFWATFVEPDPGDPKSRLLTVWGQGRINVNSANPQTLWAITCGFAEEQTPLCVDPVQAQAFVMGVQLAQSLLQGAPLFTSEKDFVNVMEGKGPLGEILLALEVQPVKFKSAAELKKAITTESKMFSIYADGVIPGRRHETRVRVHAVVDFRSAAELGEAGFSPIAGGMPQPVPGQDPANTETPPEATPETIAAALASNPAGNVVYWRIE
jgi:general secretion pathway protein K